MFSDYTELQEEMSEIIKTGKSFHIYFKTPNANKRKIHIITLFEDVGIKYAVIKWWSKNKSRWIYNIESFYFLGLLKRDNNFK